MEFTLKRLGATGALVGILALAATSAEAQDTTTVGRAATDCKLIATDSAHKDSLWGNPTDSNAKAQNPPGYRGMERPTNVFPLDSAADSVASRDTTSRARQMRQQDSAAARGQNPPGYRGMERPAALDSIQQRADSCPPAKSKEMKKKKTLRLNKSTR